MKVRFVQWAKEGVVYTMDHEVVSRPCNICDWLLNSSRDYYGLHQDKKNVKVFMERKVSQRHVLRLPLSTDMVQRVLRWSMHGRETLLSNIFHAMFFGEEKMTTREWSKFIYLFISNLPIWGHILEKSTHSFFGAWSFLLVHIRFMPSEGAQRLCNLLFII